MKNYVIAVFAVTIIGISAAARADDLRMTTDEIHEAPAVTATAAPARPQDVEPAAGPSAGGNLRMTTDEIHEPAAATATVAPAKPQDVEPAAGGRTDNNLRMTTDEIHEMGQQ
jgi:hypothetical protein